MHKITEIIPDSIPDWAKDAMDDGQFFRIALDRIASLEAQLKEWDNIKDDLLRDIIECEPSALEDEMTICIHYDTLNNILDKHLPSPPKEKES